MLQYYAKSPGNEEPARAHLISSIRVDQTPSHWHLHIWNRGGKSGVITVNATDGQAIVDRLLPPSMREGPSLSPSTLDELVRR